VYASEPFDHVDQILATSSKEQVIGYSNRDVTVEQDEEEEEQE